VSTESEPARWAQHTLDAWRTLRQLHQEAADLRLVVKVSIEVIRERDRELAAEKERTAHLRAQIRSFMSGRTIADERCEIEREELDRGVGEDAAA
jgi:hypothetical protein